MIYKCPNCNAALEYNAVLDKMKCDYCGGVYEVGELNTQTKQALQEEEIVSTDDGETMSCKIYCCTSCAAEIMVNDVEVSTFCAYCGQPTIVFSRMSGELRPKYIVPFSITKEDAMERIRERVKNSQFVPKKIKNYSVENIRGIYIPYRLYDIDYHDEQMWKNEPVKKEFHSTKIYKRYASYTFKDFPVAMSMRLDSMLTQRLEPFDLSCKRSFSPEYLSGYYADKYDMSRPQTSMIASEKMKDLFDSAVKETINDSGAVLQSSNPQKEVLGSAYTFLPAWFLTFRYEDRPYTFMVNGQTGKVVGSLPIQKSKVILFFTMVALILCPLCAGILALLADIISGFVVAESILLSVLTWIGIFASIFYLLTYLEYKGLKRIYSQTASGELAEYAHERQDK